MVRFGIPDNVNLSNKNGTADGHGNSDNRKIHARKFKPSDADMFSGKNIPPQKSSQRRTECHAKCTVVDAESHAIYRCPERTIADRDPVQAMNLLPCLYHAREKNGGTNIRASNLAMD